MWLGGWSCFARYRPNGPLSTIMCQADKITSNHGAQSSQQAENPARNAHNMSKPETAKPKALQANGPKKNTKRYKDGTRAGVGGRKSTYTEAIGLEICARMAEGESLTMVCKDKGLPSRGTVTRWVLDNPAFRARYAQARESLLDVYADQILSISDDGTTDYITKVGRNGHEYEAVDQEHIQRSRLRVDSRKWLLSKLRPEQYGDRMVAEVQGSVSHTHDISTLSERERMRRFALFMVEDTSQAPIEGQLANVSKTQSPTSPAPIDKTEPDASA